MGARLYSEVQALDKEVKVFHGSFAPNGSSAVDATSNKGAGWSVVRTSAGLFTLTMADRFVKILSVNATLQLAAGDDKLAQVGSVSESGRTVEIRVWDISAAAVADVAANANNRINFVIAVKNSSAAI